MSYIVEKYTTCNTCSTNECKHGPYYVLRDSKGNYIKTVGKNTTIGKNTTVTVNDFNVNNLYMHMITENKDLEGFMKGVLNKEGFNKYFDTTNSGIPDKSKTFKLNVDNNKLKYSINNNKLKFIKVSYKYGYDSDDTVTITFEKQSATHDPDNSDIYTLDDYDINDIIDNIKNVHRENQNVVDNEVQKFKDEYQDDIEKLVWYYGSKENINNMSKEEIMEKFNNLDEDMVSSITNYDTETSRRIDQEDTSEEFENFIDEIPNIGYKSKNKIEDKFYCIEHISNSDIDNIKNINGVGDKTVDKIKWYSNKYGENPDKEISNEETVKRVNDIKDEFLNKGLVKDIKDKNSLKNWGIFKPNKTISMNKSLDKGGSKIKYYDGDESYETVLAHELSHALEGSINSNNKDRFGEPYDPHRINDFSEESKREIEFFSRYVHNDDRRKPNERFTNYISSLISEPKRTKKMLPNFSEEFEKDVLENTSSTRKRMFEKIFDY